jgi:GWxTD domain-containing protein
MNIIYKKVKYFSQKKCSFLLLFLSILISVTSNISTYSQQEKQNNDLFVNCDYSVFFVENNVFQVEFYYSFPDISYTLIFDEATKKFNGNLEFLLQIDSVQTTSQNSSMKKHISNYIWKIPTSSDNYFSEKAEEMQDFFGLYKFKLIPGKYLANIQVKDLNDENRKFNHEFEIIINPLEPNKINISDLQMANQIMPKNTALQSDADNNLLDIFYKNQFYVYPNPLREISSDYPTLYLYSEIYSAKSVSPEGIELKYLIKNSKNDVELEYAKEKPALADAIVETIAIPLDALQSGVYTAELIAKSKNTKAENNELKNNENAKDSVKKQIKFYLINNNVGFSENIYYTEDEMFDLSEFATYGEERADLEFEYFKVIAATNEIKTWEKLSELKAKQRFLYRFWRNRNPKPEEQYNSELETFRTRLNYATTYYSFGGHSNGWKTDRGKIYIKYGEADYEEKSFETPTQRAYEIWTYGSVEGGGVFCFVDLFGMGNYQLVHSTVTGYVPDYNWRERLPMNSNSATPNR